jgi:hypothetical protein
MKFLLTNTVKQTKKKDGEDVTTVTKTYAPEDEEIAYWLTIKGSETEMLGMEEELEVEIK